MRGRGAGMLAYKRLLLFYNQDKETPTYVDYGNYRKALKPVISNGCHL